MPDAVACDLSILIPVNSRPRHLSLVLAGIAQVRLPTTEFRGEVVVRHTGGDAGIGAEVLAWQSRPPFTGANWRLVYDAEPVDSGNRSENRNAAIARSTGARLVFLDADCIPARDFLIGHWQLLTPGHFVGGDALRLSEAFSEALTVERVAAEDPLRWITAEVAADQRRRRARVSRHIRAAQMHKIPLQGGNFSCWREDMLAINGFDCHYAGWGQEDSDIGTRLFLLGCQPVNGVGQATALHIWHPPLDRPAQWKDGVNVGYFLRPGRMIRCRHGLTERLPADIRVAIDATGAAEAQRKGLAELLAVEGFSPAADLHSADWVLGLADQPTAPRTTPRQIGIGLSAAPPGLVRRWLSGQGGLKGASWWFIAGADPERTRAQAPVGLQSQIGGTIESLGSAGWQQALRAWLKTIG